MEWFYENDEDTLSEEYVLVDSAGTPVPSAAEGSYMMHHVLRGTLLHASNEDADNSAEGNGTAADEDDDSDGNENVIVVEDDWAATDDFPGMAAMREKLSAMYLLDDNQDDSSVPAAPAPSMVTSTAADEQTGKRTTSGMQQSTFSREYTPEEEEWILEEILKRRIDKETASYVYLCRWKWYREPTWESRALLEDEGYVNRLNEFDHKIVAKGLSASVASQKKASSPPVMRSLVEMLPELLNTVEVEASKYGWKVSKFAPVENRELHRNFVQKWNMMPEAKLKVLFHGSRLNNFMSIETHGLIIPGRRGVKVAHGSAYGLGIYTAKNPSYSASYAQDRTMFVCLGLLQNRTYHSIREVNDICVFFDDRLVVPVMAVQFETYGAFTTREEYPSVRALLNALGAYHQVSSVAPAAAPQVVMPGNVADATGNPKAKGGMTKKMLKQAPKSIKELYKAGVLKQRKQRK
jgi:hypothetical protein